jgi:hypothetical protein
MRPLLFVVSLLLFSCAQNPSNEKTEALNDTTGRRGDTTAKPPETTVVYTSPDEATVNAALGKEYSNQWHVLNDKTASWMKDVFDYFIVPRRKTEPNYPYIAKGDFNGDGRRDIAAVVTDSTKIQYRVAILLDTNKAIFWDEDILEDAAISTVPRADIDGMDGERTKKVKMKGDGINVEYFERGAFVLYWDKTGFKRIQTGD